jgi:hypothetical protein
MRVGRVETPNALEGATIGAIAPPRKRQQKGEKKKKKKKKKKNSLEFAIKLRFEIECGLATRVLGFRDYLSLSHDAAATWHAPPVSSGLQWNQNAAHMTR